jgi:Spy/CpxP family protein refolding chaperone
LAGAFDEQEVRMRQMIGVGVVALGAALGLALAAEGAADSPYAGMETRWIKALAPEEIASLRAGGGMGLAMAAELNRYPGPRHVLDLADDLTLTPAQRDGARALYAAVTETAPRIGAAIVADEDALDRLFAAGAAETEAVADLVARIAARRGELRLVHLDAHIRMRALLTPHQIMLYDRLRGYSDDGSAGHEHGHGPQ